MKSKIYLLSLLFVFVGCGKKDQVASGPSASEAKTDLSDSVKPSKQFSLQGGAKISQDDFEPHYKRFINSIDDLGVKTQLQCTFTMGDGCSAKIEQSRVTIEKSDDFTQYYVSIKVDRFEEGCSAESQDKFLDLFAKDSHLSSKEKISHIGQAYEYLAKELESSDEEESDLDVEIETTYLQGTYEEQQFVQMKSIQTSNGEDYLKFAMNIEESKIGEAFFFGINEEMENARYSCHSLAFEKVDVDSLNLKNLDTVEE